MIDKIMAIRCLKIHFTVIPSFAFLNKIRTLSLHAKRGFLVQDNTLSIKRLYHNPISLPLSGTTKTILFFKNSQAFFYIKTYNDRVKNARARRPPVNPHRKCASSATRVGGFYSKANRNRTENAAFFRNSSQPVFLQKNEIALPEKRVNASQLTGRFFNPYFVIKLLCTSQ